GWSLSGFVFARSAPPVSLIAAMFRTGSVALNARPNLTPGVPLELYGSGYPGSKIYNRAAFTAPLAGQEGIFGRNGLRGWGAPQADIGVQRQFPVTERCRLRFRA